MGTVKFDAYTRIESVRPLLNPESRGRGPFGGDILLSLHALVTPSTTNGSAAQSELEIRRACLTSKFDFRVCD